MIKRQLYLKVKNFKFKNISLILIILLFISCKEPVKPLVSDNFTFAKLHQEDLQLSVYITAHQVDNLLSLESGRREALSLLRANGITKVYIEVYRSGLIVSPDLLKSVSAYFKENGFEVVGAIATTPGKDFGVRQKGQLTWFNWQNPKTQEDIRNVMLDAAPVFDTFIVDDFLLTADVSDESIKAKGDKSWSTYRRELLTDLATSVFIDPAKSVNPDINMIIKYPQSYDVFHTFGYDVETGPKLFDGVWVGTESRGQYTQRFGFVQPYEGFINYRWISTLAGDKIGAAWFDHGDCDKLDFIEQAYQSVLAGAKELVIFNYGSFVNGHPGHHLLRMDFEKLLTLSKTVQSSPVQGVIGYKPPHSDAGGDLYIMDFIGMFGIPLVPDSSYPDKAKTIFLPTQAATDTEIAGKIVLSVQQGARIIMTSGFLANVKNGDELLKMVGISKPIIHPLKAEKVKVGNVIEDLTRPLDLEANFKVMDASVVLEAVVAKEALPFLTKSKNGQIFVINSHTFSQADFDAVGEVLLCPRPLGLIELPKPWVNTIRGAFNNNVIYKLDAPVRVSMQTLQNGDIVIHNYRQEATEVVITGVDFSMFYDAFEKKDLKFEKNEVLFQMEPRSRVWLRKSK